MRTYGVDLVDHVWFTCCALHNWCGFKSNNEKVSPVELLVLGSLRYLGCGWTFDDCEESTAIDKEVHRRFSRFLDGMEVQSFTKSG